MPSSVQPGQRHDLWLALLKRLTAIEPTWLVWKNVDSALHGAGDIDSAAHPGAWDALEREFVAWASDWSVRPVVQCSHIPGGRNLVAVPEGSPTFLELSIKNDKAFRGSTLFVLDDLLAMSQMDPRGFRRLRPGAEGLLKLVLNGSKWFGRADAAGLESKHVRELLRSDRAGVAAAAPLFGRAQAAAERLADAVADGSWDRRAMLMIEANAVARGFRRPGAVITRARFRLVTQRSCPVVYAIGHGREVGTPRARWLDEVARNHRVYEPDGALPLEDRA